MTQASLSPDLHGALGATPSLGAVSTRDGSTSEASLWMIALTSSGLVVAALLLLSLLVRNVVSDASMGGFVSGAGIVIAFLGIGGVSYATVTARRAGYLNVAESPAADRPAATTAAVPAGMRVVSALPADLGQRKRRQLEAERAARTRQAKAIAAAMEARTSRPVAPPRPAPVSAAPPHAVPRASGGHPAGPVTTYPSRPASLRPVSAQATRPTASQPAPVRVATARVMPQAPTGVAITMPGSVVRPPRPSAWPAQAAFPGKAAPPLRPRTQVATLQVHAANIRAAAPARYTLPPAAGSRKVR